MEIEERQTKFAIHEAAREGRRQLEPPPSKISTRGVLNHFI